ncbi:phosphate acetyltransferase [Legionella taurinensis]|uniref:Phosphate acetyltransferase n=2 Tax=Legionella taurinensis TaxID=70611 RepID=A0A3A5LRV6_9GAMM|nr:phosphate acetyltransferase [Legionella taurinensis]RJT68984.1 phosphate acetyltransferase [Legionella taurinensis]
MIEINPDLIMQRKIYFTGIEKRCGKSFVSLGLLASLKEQCPDLRCYKLFSEADNSQIPLLKDLSQSQLNPLMDVNQGILMMRNQPDDLLSQVFEATQCTEKTKISYFEGTDFESDNDAFEFQFNLTLASQLNCDLIVVVSARERTLEHTFSLLNTTLEAARKQHANLVGIIINRVAHADENDYQERLLAEFGHLALTTVIPEFDALANPTVQDVAQKLNADVICGKDELLRPVKQMTIAAKTVGNFLESRLDRNGMLIITPSDRVDILLGSLLADQSANYPKIAGIVLTGGEMPGSVLCEIIAGLERPFPVLLTQCKTYETATTLYSAKFSLNQDNPGKVADTIIALKPFLYEPVINLLQHQSLPNRLSPAVFLYELIRRAKQAKRHIVLPEGDEPRILIAADHLLKRNVVKITLLGNPDKIHLLAKRMDLTLPNVQIIDVETSLQREQFAHAYYELRKHKNVNLPIALERMSDVNYFAAMMVYTNQADGMVSGAVHTTADTVRPALEIIKTKLGVTKVSSIFIMCMPSRVLIYGDCAINPEPDSITLAEIALQAVNIAKQLGIEPKVALLSYSSGSSGKGNSVEKVAKAMALVKQQQPELLAEGPIQYDAAVDPEVARKKLPDSRLAGDANVLIFPDLNTGNNTYKAVQRESGALAIGPVLLGLNKPVNDLSRGCTPQDIINTILVTAIQVEGDSA